jgi:hypothetical protein
VCNIKSVTIAGFCFGSVIDVSSGQLHYVALLRDGAACSMYVIFLLSTHLSTASGVCCAAALGVGSTRVCYIHYSQMEAQPRLPWSPDNLVNINCGCIMWLLIMLLPSLPNQYGYSKLAMLRCLLMNVHLALALCITCMHCCWWMYSWVYI